MPYPDLDELRSLLSHAHTPKKAGFVRRMVSHLKNKFSSPDFEPVTFPPPKAQERNDKVVDQDVA